MARRHHILRNLHGANVDMKKPFSRLDSRGYLSISNDSPTSIAKPDQNSALENENDDVSVEDDLQVLIDKPLRVIKKEIDSGEWDKWLDEILMTEYQRDNPRITLNRIIEERKAVINQE